MKLLILDGHALVFRAYYAFQSAGLTNSLTGAPSGAVFGFFKMFFKLIHDFKPTHTALAFDPGTPLERNKIFPNYKANRAPMPEELRPQVEEILQICEHLGFPILRIPGIEADDIIATLCERYATEFEEILIFSSDKDLFQILKDNIKMLRGKKGATDFIVIDSEWVKTELGIEPKQIPDFMGIVGDSSDNIPGVKGIGEKGAAKLIQEFSNLENLYENIEKVKNPSMKEKLATSKENAFLSRTLATIDRSVSLSHNVEDLKIPNFLELNKIQIFKDKGFNALYRDLSKEANLELGLEVKQDKKEKIISNAEKGTYIRIRNKEDLNTLCNKLKNQKILSVDTETTSTNPMLAEILGISISFEEKLSYYIPIQHSKSKFNSESFPIGEVVQSLKSILENSNILKIGQNIKYDSIILKKYGIDITPIHFDTMLASYVLGPEGRRHNMDDLASEWLGYKTITYEELTKKGKKQVPLYEIPLDEVTEYAGEDADITLRLYNKLKPEVEKQGLQEILENIEIPLITVLRDMEMTGVSIDKEYLKELSKEYHVRVEQIEKEIFKLIGHSFNLNSTRELQVVLYDELKLPKVKLTATGISTDHSALESIADKHPSIPLLLEYRKLTKLLNTYIDALPKMINPITKRIHTSFNQTIAATGRLSSTDPNLQNIPIKDKEGKQIRKAFIPSSYKYEILSLDYSQIELRIMAHFSKDPNMIKAYMNNIDIHSQTAGALFGVNEHLVTPEQRNKAKIVNFSVIYGTSAYGLAEQLKISKTEAGIFIDKYFLQYPKVKEFMEKISKECFEKGYVETLTGRRRYIPEIKSSKRQEVEAAKRIAINSPIQGTSADMIKIAMIRIHDYLRKQQKKSKMILQVHDELVFEVHKEEKEEIFQLAKREMENAVRLDVPVVVEGSFAKNWAETG